MRTQLSPLFLFLALMTATSPEALSGPSLGLSERLVSEEPLDDAGFPLVAAEGVAPIWYDADDFPGVLRAIGDLQSDIGRVTDREPKMGPEQPAGKMLVIVGTLGKSAPIDRLVAAGKLDDSDLKGKWESFAIETLERPMPGVEKALVIAGSDKRGTIYGIYELSEQLGVSPWYWWADVPSQKRASAYVAAGRYASGEPAVRYRGIFLNDEAPCLTGWAKEKFGDLNSEFYVNVFELLLRLRGNYLWPAMWQNAFNEDDPESPRLADEYGIVMGTSHHEPMMRAHKEWTVRSDQYGNGKWNYASNGEALRRFFREGIARNKDYENLITIGMRGDGDVGLASIGGMESDMDLLRRIFADQRDIIADEMQVDPSRVPQLWALFTEVQKFYEHGLRPPDDVTLLWTDDNAFNLRRLPTDEERKRSGGAGIYCHFDMHGGPYAYQWINTIAFTKIWEQMNLAIEYEADRIWIVNVGDLKPLELPIEFFLRMAWDPEAVDKDQIGAYTRKWAEREFGAEYAGEIADIVSRYMKYNSSWRKPGQIKPDTFSLLNYGEAESVEAAWRDLAEDAEAMYWKISPESRDAFFQLVMHPVKASAIVNEINIVAGRNHLYAKQGRASANALAERTRELFKQDAALSDYYNHQLAGGKWNHMMDQAHLGQSSWEPPIVNIMPPVSEVLPAADRNYVVTVEGDVSGWPDHFGGASLPVFDSLQPRRSYVEVSAMGSLPIDFSIEANDRWIAITEDESSRLDRRFWVDIDWELAPEGESRGTIVVDGDRGQVRISVPAIKASPKQEQEARGRFASLDGPVAFDASAATAKTERAGVHWGEIPDYGRVGSALTVFPVTADSILPPQEAPELEYPVFLPRSGEYEVTLVLGPVMDFVPDRGMRIAVAFDDNDFEVLDIFEKRSEQTFLGAGWWNQFTRDNVRYLKSKHNIKSAGRNTLKIAMVDPGIVIQKIIVSDRRLPQSYFGPPSRPVYSGE